MSLNRLKRFGYSFMSDCIPVFIYHFDAQVYQHRDRKFADVSVKTDGIFLGKMTYTQGSKGSLKDMRNHRPLGVTLLLAHFSAKSSSLENISSRGIFGQSLYCKPAFPLPVRCRQFFLPKTFLPARLPLEFMLHG